VRILIEAGADINKASHSGWTAMLLAKNKGGDLNLRIRELT
jgi:ankyrin repeat protein